MGIFDWIKGPQGKPPQASMPTVHGPAARPPEVGPQFVSGPQHNPSVVHPPRARPPESPTFKVVDVPGSWGRAVNGDHHFESAVAALPLGPLKVTLALIPNPDNPFAVAALVGGSQVGWLATERSADDPFFKWMKRLEAARIRPRLNGECSLRDSRQTRIIHFEDPGRNDGDLDAIADRVISGT